MYPVICTSKLQAVALRMFVCKKNRTERKEICNSMFIRDIWDVFELCASHIHPPKKVQFSAIKQMDLSFLLPFTHTQSKCHASWNEWGSQYDLSSTHSVACCLCGLWKVLHIMKLQPQVLCCGVLWHSVLSKQKSKDLHYGLETSYKQQHCNFIELHNAAKYNHIMSTKIK